MNISLFFDNLCCFVNSAQKKLKLQLKEIIKSQAHVNIEKALIIHSVEKCYKIESNAEMKVKSGSKKHQPFKSALNRWWISGEESEKKRKKWEKIMRTTFTDVFFCRCAFDILFGLHNVMAGLTCMLLQRFYYFSVGSEFNMRRSSGKKEK